MLRGILASAVLLIILLALWVITDGDARPDIPGFGLAEVTGHDLAELDKSGQEIRRPGGEVEDDLDDLQSFGLRVVVRALTQAGEPVPAAQLEVSPAPDPSRPGALDLDPALDDMRLVRTDENGRVAVAVPYSGSWLLRLRAENFALATRRVELRLGAVRPPVEFLLEPGQTLSGRIVDAAGAPVPGVDVTAYRADQPDEPLAVHASGKEGEIRFGNLPRGDVLLVGGRAGDPADRLATVRVPDVSRIVIPLPEPASIEGVVLAGEGDDGVVDARVTVHCEGAWVPILTARTDSSGRYIVGGIPSGRRVHVTADAPGYAAGAVGPADAPQVARGGHRSRLDVRLWPAAGAVTGAVRDGKRRPLSDMPLQLLGRSVVGRVVRRTTVSGSTGTFRFTGVPDGEYVVMEAVRPGRRGSVFRVGLPAPPDPENGVAVDAYLRRAARVGALVQVADAATSQHDVAFEAGVDVSGRVRGADGRPVAGAIVRIVGGATGSTDRGGRFRLRGVRPGPVRLEAAHPEHSPSDPVELDSSRSGVAPVLDLRAAATLAGQVTDGSGRPVPGTVLRLVWEDDAGPPPEPLILSPADAERLQRAVPVRGSTVRVHVAAPGYAGRVCGPFSARPGGILLLGAVRLEPMVRLTGTLLDDRGLELPGGQVVAGDVVVGVAGADGKFEVRAAPGAGDALQFRAAGFLPRSGLRLAPGRLELVGLSRAVRFSGRVEDARGRPVGGMLLTLRPAGSDGPDAPRHVTRTDQNGRFVLDDLSAGAWTLAGAPRRTPKRPDGDFVVLPETPVRLPTETTVFRTTDTASVRGEVRDGADRPLPGLPVTARRGDVTVSTHTRLDGSFELPGVSVGGTWTLAAGAWGTRHAPVVVHGVAAGATGLDLTVDHGASLTVRCVDAAGEPVALDGATHVVVEVPSIGARVSVAGNGESTEVRGLPKGKATVHVQPGKRLAGFVRSGTASARIPSDEPVTVRLPPAAAIGGVVTGIDGEPLGGVEVRAVPLDAPRAIGVWAPGSAVAHTEPDGSFRLIGLVPDALFAVIATGGPGFGVRAEEPVKSGTGDLAIRLAPGRTVTGILTDAAGHPVPHATVAVLRDGRTLVSWAETDATGSFRLEGVPSTDLSVGVRTAEALAKNVDLGTLDRSSSTVDLRLPRP